MSVVQGQAVRRRAGVAPNTLVMAEHGSATPEMPYLQCPVGRCKNTFEGHQFPELDEHVALAHPRSQYAPRARQRALDRKHLDPVSEILSRG